MNLPNGRARYSQVELKVFIKIGKRFEVLGWDGESLTVGINSPPVKGAANDKLIELLSEWLNISKNKIHLIGGHTTRHKIIDIDIEKVILDTKIAEIPKLPRQMNLL